MAIKVDEIYFDKYIPFDKNVFRLVHELPFDDHDKIYIKLTEKT